MFKEGTVRHIAVVDKFNEGVHIPQAEVVAFLRATNSERIFLQQLGRILSKNPGKLKVTVLDFVANIDRIRKVKALMMEISTIAGIETARLNNANSLKLNEAIHLEGTGFSFNFTDEVVNILSVFEKVSVPFYSTWQEAASAAIELGITNSSEYKKEYSKDLRLPSSPNSVYSNFPGFTLFFGRKVKDFYSTWKEASESAKKLEIASYADYKERYKEDSKLPCNPQHVYANFPGFTVFLGLQLKSCYETWQEASIAAINLGIKSIREYRSHYKEDPQLHCEPHRKYDDFPGWYEFLRTEKHYYPTWQEAASAAKNLNIGNADQYVKQKLYKQDPKLIGWPVRFYSDFPGWAVFFGRKKKPNRRSTYSTWQEAASAAIVIGISSQRTYRELYKNDPLLPSRPETKYKDFPGWITFFDNKKKTFYSTWREASKASIALEIKTLKQYRENYKNDSRLPSLPSKYKNFPGWHKFLGKE